MRHRAVCRHLALVQFGGKVFGLVSRPDCTGPRPTFAQARVAWSVAGRRRPFAAAVWRGPTQRIVQRPALVEAVNR